jgi:hypothetical protein
MYTFTRAGFSGREIAQSKGLYIFRTAQKTTKVFQTSDHYVCAYLGLHNLFELICLSRGKLYFIPNTSVEIYVHRCNFQDPFDTIK